MHCMNMNPRHYKQNVKEMCNAFIYLMFQDTLHLLTPKDRAKKIIRFSSTFLKKQMREAGFLF